MVMTDNRISKAIAQMRAKLGEEPFASGKTLDGGSLTDFEAKMAIDPVEHAKYQEVQSVMYAAGGISLDEAAVIYQSLGEYFNADNGGWAEGVDLATKVVITQTMKELIEARIQLLYRGISL